MTHIKRYPLAPQPEQFERALAAGAVEERVAFGVRYQRVSRDYRNMPRGVVRIDGCVVPAYPSVGRIFALGAGVRQAFAGPFHAEEKIDGYNVRIVRAAGRLLPLTRSGMVCPFSFDRLPDLVDPDALAALFDAEPGLILCAEIAGPGNPYMPTASTRWGEDIGLFAFDLMRCGSQSFVPEQQRTALLDRYGIPQAPRLGRFTVDELPRLAEEVLRLDREGGEGVVLKPPGEGGRVKYVTPGINLTDIVSDAALELELPGEFYTHRVVRMVMALRELGQQQRLEEMGTALGAALVQGFAEAVAEVERGGEVSRIFVVRLRRESSCDALLEHVGYRSRSVDIKEVSRRSIGGYYELTFRKVFRRSSDKLKTLLSGGSVFD